MCIPLTWRPEAKVESVHNKNPVGCVSIARLGMQLMLREVGYVDAFRCRISEIVAAREHMVNILIVDLHIRPPTISSTSRSTPAGRTFKYFAWRTMCSPDSRGVSAAHILESVLLSGIVGIDILSSCVCNRDNLCFLFFWQRDTIENRRKEWTN